MLDARSFEMRSRGWEQGLGGAARDTLLPIRGASPSPEIEVDVKIKVLSKIFKVDKTSF